MSAPTLWTVRSRLAEATQPIMPAGSEPATVHPVSGAEAAHGGQTDLGSCGLGTFHC